MNAAQPIPFASVASRQIKMLRSAMGPAIAAALENPDVVEVLLNPDGSLWLDTLSHGRSDTGQTLSREDDDRIIRLVAAHVRVEVNRDCPRAASGSRA